MCHQTQCPKIFLVTDVGTGRLDRGGIVFNKIDLLRICCTRCQILLSFVVKEELYGFRCTNLWGMLKSITTKKCTCPNSSYSTRENVIKSLTLRLQMSYVYIYIYIYMEHQFLMFLDHTQRRTTVGRTPLDE